jgi:glycosyltransferase involved in cell wall biosynthesis
MTDLVLTQSTTTQSTATLSTAPQGAPTQGGAREGADMDADNRPRVCVVGSGWRFTSGISYYTCHLSGALADRASVSAILIRRLLPKAVYPGRDRVGKRLAALDYDPRVEVYDGVDWFWGPSIVGAIRHIRRTRPNLLVLQWWTGTVAHSYLALALAARAVGARVIVEFHEVQDTGEARLPLVSGYTRRALAGILRRSDGFLVHSEYDRGQLSKTYDLTARPVVVVPHGPFAHHQAVRRAGEEGVCRLLFFGTIRPYKGLEYLVEAFSALTAQEAAGFRLTVVGETWEGWTRPLELIEASPHRARITVVNRYVSDDEVTGHFADADAVVLPYLRSSASGPLHIAMSNGLPVVVTSVGGLSEAVADYDGAILVEPGDVAGLIKALLEARTRAGDSYAERHSWQRNVEAILSLAAGPAPDAAERP